MAGLVCDHMESDGTKLLKGVVPLRVSKLDDGQLEVEWADNKDRFDTILCAIGECLMLLNRYHYFLLNNVIKPGARFPNGLQ